MYQKLKLSQSAAAGSKGGVRVVCLGGSELSPKQRKSLAGDDAGLSELLGQADTTLEAGQVRTLYHAEGDGPARTVLVGLGDSKKISADAVRLAAAAAVRELFAAKITSASVQVDGAEDRLSDEQVGRAIGEGMVLANFTFDEYHGNVKRPEKKEKSISLSVWLPEDQQADFKVALKVGEGITTARTLSATPPNVANSKYIASYCKNLAKKTGLKCTVIDAKRAKELKMGGLLAVGAGGSTPPCVVILEWEGKGKSKKSSGGAGTSGTSGTSGGGPLLLVGKGVTFDTGGYSLKGDGGKGMKYDKCGGMNVIGAMQAIANLKLKQRVVGIIGLAENMIDRDAYRVDDILTLSNGVTCEVTNTDAEGRLVLADCLAYGTKTYNPAAVVDFGTLTGGVVVALGKKIAGIWCNDEALKQKLDAAGEASGEPVWQLPLNDDYRKMMQSKHADLHNSAPVREAHPIQGAAFLSYFVGPDAPKSMPTIPWAHIDIAGTSNTEGDVLMEKGPTGYGVRLATELAATM